MIPSSELVLTFNKHLQVEIVKFNIQVKKEMNEKQVKHLQEDWDIYPDSLKRIEFVKERYHTWNWIRRNYRKIHIYQ
jgi:hypothetical protein